MALIEMLSHMESEEQEIYLYVLSGQGELIHQVPRFVKILNGHIDDTPVLSQEGTKKLIHNLIKRGFLSGALFYRIPYLVKNTCIMLRNKTFSLNKLTRRLLSDTTPPLPGEYDLAVAYLEGGASFYVADKVKAKKKAAFVHVDYNQAGYNRSLDCNCYLRFDQIFTVSEEVRTAFLSAYPECASYTGNFYNIMNRERIEKKAEEPGGFSDGYEGFRILTVGRLYAQKAFEVSIAAMKRLKDAGIAARWYVLGEGEEREKLSRLIKELGLEEDFLLCGAVENPYPYFAQTDLYVHASRFEGKSIAIQEAQVLGCTILVSDCSGNREQVKDGVDGRICSLTPEAIAETIEELYRDKEQRKRLGEGARMHPQVTAEELQKLYRIM